MDRDLYMLHARKKLVKEYEAMITKMSDPEILELMGSCPSCNNLVASFPDIDRAIVEGSSLGEVDRLMGADDHCAKSQSCSNEPSDEQIDGTFRDGVDMVTDRESPTIIVSYAYFDGPDETAGARNRTYIFGDRSCLGMLMDSIIDKVESADDDDGHVTYLDDSDS